MDNRALYNPEAERQVIGSLLNSPTTHKHIAALEPDDFADAIRRRLYVAIRDMVTARQAVDLVTVDRAMGGNTDAMTEMVQCAHTAVAPSMIEAHIRLVKDASQRRRIVEIGERLTLTAADPMTDAAATIEDARQALRTATMSRSEWVDMHALVQRTYQWLERRIKGDERPIQSGLVDLDKLIGGFFPGELTVIGARPSAGKSQMGMSIALAGAKRGCRVCFASLEMVVEQYGQRVFSREADVNGMRMRNALIGDDEWARIVEAMPLTAALPMSFLFDSAYIEDIVAAVRHKADAGEIDMLVVDYLQLVRSRKRFEADRLRVAHISHTLKDITRDLGIPVIALAQVGRTAQGAMPCMSDLRDSGDIEQDADNVIFLHKPTDIADKAIHPSDLPYFDGILQSGKEYVAIKVDKQRQGQTGIVCVLSDPSRMRYTCIDRRTKGDQQA